MDQNQNPNLNPAPTNTVAPKLPWYQQPWVASIGSAVLVGGLLIGYDIWARPAPQPYQPPLAAAAKQYRDTLPDAFHKTAEQVRATVLTDKNGVVGALKTHAQPLATALDTTFAPLVDPLSGKITNVSSAADVLDQTAKALGSKF